MDMEFLLVTANNNEQNEKGGAIASYPPPKSVPLYISIHQQYKQLRYKIHFFQETIQLGSLTSHTFAVACETTDLVTY